MKKILFLLISVVTVSEIQAQNITDALRYSNDEIQGTARYRALSGAFGALGGDMSAVSVNPAGSAIFNFSHASISLISSDVQNDATYYNGFSSSSNSDIDLNQAGAAIVLRNRDDNNDWRRIVIGFAYDRTNNFEEDWFAFGRNTNSIDSYFLSNAQGLRLDEISAFSDETYTEAYGDIGSVFGYGHQQAFLGYESYILEPENDTDDNTVYFSNIAPGTFDQEFSYAARGYNGKFSFNFATQYQDNLYLGLNLNAHFIDYVRSTYFYEENSNPGSIVNEVGFENNLSTVGDGFSFQLGAIAKLSDNFRVGLAFDSPVWYTISEETTQSIATEFYDGIITNDGETIFGTNINPQIVNIFPNYKLQTPSKITGSLAYIFGNDGLISFDYSRKNYSNAKFKPTSDNYFAAQNDIINNSLKASSTYKIGGEYKIKQFSLRGGYRFEESPYENESTIGDLTGYSLGLGYNFGNTRLDLTYDTSERDTNYQLFDAGLTDAVRLNSNRDNITLSLSFNL